MKCNGTENSVEGEKPPSAVPGDVPCEKSSTSNGSNEPSPSTHHSASAAAVAKRSPDHLPDASATGLTSQQSGIDATGGPNGTQANPSGQSSQSKMEPKLETSRPGSACPEGLGGPVDTPWGQLSGMAVPPHKQEYPSSSTPGTCGGGSSQVTPSNGGTASSLPATGLPPQQAFIFTTAMANQAAEAVLTGHFPSIVAFHCSQPGTRRMIEQRRAAMIGAISNCPTWTPNGPLASNIPTHQSGYIGNHSFSPAGHFHGGILSAQPGAPCFPSGGNPSTANSRSMGLIGGGSVVNMQSPMAMQSSMPVSHSGSMSALPGGATGGGGPTNGANRPMSGVKVPDENLTPQQRQHREEQLATLRKMQQWLFPDQQQQQQQSGTSSSSGMPGNAISAAAANSNRGMMPPLQALQSGHLAMAPSTGQHSIGPSGGPIGSYGQANSMASPKGLRGQFPAAPRHPGPGGPSPQASQYNFRPPDQPRSMSPAMMIHPPHSPYGGGPMGGPGGPSPDPSQMVGNFKPSTSPQLHPQPPISPHLNAATSVTASSAGSKAGGSKSGNSSNNPPISPVDIPGNMMSSPQHMGTHYNPMESAQQQPGPQTQQQQPGQQQQSGVPGGPTTNDPMLSNDPLASLESFENNGMNHPGNTLGGPSPGPCGRMGGPVTSPYNSGGPVGPPMGPRARQNLQVRSDAPNTIQYHPARSQGPGGGPIMHGHPHHTQRGPSLDFLQRYGRPQDINSMKTMSAGGQLVGHMMSGNQLNHGGPLAGGGPISNAPLGVATAQSIPVGGPGGHMSNGPVGPSGHPVGSMQYYPDPPQQSAMGAFGGPSGISSGPAGSSQNKPFYTGPTTADPNYAAQFHNFQQQLYATNTTKGLK